ncbi:glycosyltransferase family 4 protein [Halopelagius fulvigenes]|uniref:Glycosyltransferase family 4 protein n=1 Tax=Halopelagius fulvigenes TaxID=1198324 RepID=A0ABD5TY67_9EURY
MHFIGYFPGSDFASESQYGRRTHVFKLTQEIGERTDVRSTFYFGNPAGEFANLDVRSVDASGSFAVKLKKELELARTLVTEVRSSPEPTVIYCREAPDLAPTIAARFTDAALVVEANSGHVEELEDHDSVFESYRHRLLREMKWRTADRVIAVSADIAEQLSERGVTDVTVVENGVDVDLFSVRRPVSTEPPYTIGYVGGLQPQQNVEFMFDVVAALDTPVQFNVVGGSESEVSRLEAIVTDLELEDKVEFFGRVPHEDVPEYMNDADLCFGPFERIRPSSPLKIYEYLACGRTVVVVNDEGLQYFTDYPGVHVFPHGDAADIASKVDAVLDTVETNEAGAAYVRENRSWQAIADRTVDICREAVRDNR